MPTAIDNYVNEIYEGLKSEFIPVIGQQLFDKNVTAFRRLAEHAGRLQYRIDKKERLANSLDALEDLLIICKPMLKASIMFDLDEKTQAVFWAVFQGFFAAIFSIAIASAKSYLSDSLSPQETQRLIELKTKSKL
jgi:hypothetical protein